MLFLLRVHNQKPALGPKAHRYKGRALKVIKILFAQLVVLDIRSKGTGFAKSASMKMVSWFGSFWGVLVEL